MKTHFSISKEYLEYNVHSLPAKDINFPTNRKEEAAPTNEFLSRPKASLDEVCLVRWLAFILLNVFILLPIKQCLPNLKDIIPHMTTANGELALAQNQKLSKFLPSSVYAREAQQAVLMPLCALANPTDSKYEWLHSLNQFTFMWLFVKLTRTIVHQCLFP